MKKNFLFFSSIALLTSFINFQKAYADLGTYWLGVGVGITETLCVASMDGYMTNITARNFLSSYRSNLAKSSDFDSESFEIGVQETLNIYTSCRL